MERRGIVTGYLDGKLCDEFGELLEVFWVGFGEIKDRVAVDANEDFVKHDLVLFPIMHIFF
jgi:hypothetical protein